MALQSSAQEKGALKALAAERTSQCIQSTSALLARLRHSPSSERVAKLPKDLASKLPNIKNTGSLLEQMPVVITALDAHLDNCLHSAKYLHNVRSVLMGDERVEAKSPTPHASDGNAGEEDSQIHKPATPSSS